MKQYKCIINNRDYTEWSLYNTNNLFDEVTLTDFHPIKHKLFNSDIFTINEEGVNIIHSTMHYITNIPGVLVLNGQCFGKAKNGKKLYKCIPDDKRLPVFLVPYEEKKALFSKKKVNKYITFKYVNWENKHPFGIIIQTLGSVDELYNFYEYQLYCKSLNASIQQFNKESKKAIQIYKCDELVDAILSNNTSIQDRTSSNNIISIDSKSTTDYDDAFECNIIRENKYKLSIYISNVILWIEAMSLWNSFSERVSTIYLPDKKRPMIPTVLSDCLCSLQQGEERFAFCMDVTIENDEVSDISFLNTLIKVECNHSYNDNFSNITTYQNTTDCIKILCQKYNFSLPHSKSPVDVVSFLMILMNYECGRKMALHNNGIFRAASIKENKTFSDTLPDEVQNFLLHWNNASGKYLIYDKNECSHDLLKLDSYIHITSPIRRLVDLLNIIQFQLNEKIITNISEDCKEFLNKWLHKLDYINVTMRAIRKVQMDCSLLELCKTNENITHDKHVGYVFDKLKREDGLIQYMVYIPSLKITSRITTRHEKNNYDNAYFKICIFMCENKLKQKIRLQILY